MKIIRYTDEPRHLSQRSRKVWAAISEAPGPLTLREICEACDLSSTSVAAYHLALLVRLGIIERTARFFRAYRVVEKWSWVDV